MRQATFLPILETPRAARLFMDGALRGSWLSEDERYTVKLLTSELVTNAVFHARTDIEVKVVVDQIAVNVTVRDHSTSPPSPSRPPLDATNGRGLQIVEDLSSDWGSEPTEDGKVVWFELTVPVDSSTGAPASSSDCS
ncbi:MAG: ATP-binding protein [Acidimicrobiales bacterium]